MTESPPLRSHRRALLPDTFWGRSARRLGAAVLVVAALAIGTAITDHTPDSDAQQQPFVRTGAIGTSVDARTFSAAVLGVRGASVLAPLTEEEEAHVTSGVWIIVKVRLEAHTNPTAVGYGALIDAQGRTYRATERIFEPLLGGRTLEPGIPVEGEIAFEVPVKVATHVSIRLAVEDIDQRMDAMVQVPLPITASQVAQWHTDKSPVTLEATKDVADKA